MSLSTSEQEAPAPPGPSQDHHLDDAPSPEQEHHQTDGGSAPPATESALTSQPMTATASNSSDAPATDQNDTGAQGTYGTRSRNRLNGARPNYADDKDIDMEIEAAAAKPPKSGKKGAAAAAQSNGEANGSSVSTAAGTSSGSSFSAVNTAAAPATANTTTAHAPTSSQYNVLPPPAPASKKRKAPGSSTTVSAPATSSRQRNVSAQQPRFYVETNMMSFARCGSRLNNKKQLVADDGTILQTNDHAYFICEPPGEPYYLARIMEFLHANNDPNSPIDAVRVNWYYRPKDIQRRVQDTRVVFASMHSDTCPLTSIRGTCRIEHYANIANLDDYRVQKDCFWFDKLYDRYMHRYYEVVPTDKVVNVPPHVKKVLDERWKFVLVEVGRGRDLTAASKKCRRCQEFAANHDSVDCAVCKFTYHMACVRPPLLKKPARGFAWACAACSRAQELALQARNTSTTSDSANVADDELVDDEDDSPPHGDHITRESSVGVESHPPPTAAQLAVANLWPYRYLGIHAKAEDALDYDDRIYPRASSRLGPRHQANVMVWHGRPVELVKPAEGKKKYKPATGKTQAKATTVDTDKDRRQKRPKWVIDEPPGYIARGEDEPVEVKGGKKEYTAQVTFRLPEPNGVSERGLDDDDTAPPSDYEKITEEYMEKVKPLAAQYHVVDVSTDFLTKAVEKLQEHEFDMDKALEAMRHLSIRGDLKQPDLNREEVKRFEEGVAKYGSELHLVARHVSPTIKESRIVRFYYMWKKSDRGRQIWGTYEGRKSKKESRKVEKDGSTKLLDDVADDHDDSAFDNEKAVQKKRGFVCKFCDTRSSRQWRRAPQTAPGTLVPSDPAAKNVKDKSSWLTLALCGKCAYLWRRYAIQYESVEEVARKIAAAGGRASKRRIDEELMRTVIEAQCEAGDTITKNVAQLATSAGVEVPAAMVQSDEPPKKKTKADRDPLGTTPEVVVVVEKKKVEQEPLDPEVPKVKVHPCAICGIYDLAQDKTLKCRDCRLHVHTSCYGIGSIPQGNCWYCDTCNNDHNMQVSTIYECVVCPINYTPQELMEPPRVTHKKKSDREREKERVEREMVQDAGRRWRQDQEAAGRPVNPREPLKPTASNNWIHVYCAVWTKEIKFGNPALLHAAEGMGLIPRDRYLQQCKLCKKTGFPTITCQFPNCNAVFHVGCAHSAGHKFGFDIAPVKGSRRDSVAVMKLGQEAGAATPAVWCSSHTAIPSIVHEMTETTPSGMTALQEYVRVYKQVDGSVTATARRAQQIITSSPASTAQSANRRVSMAHGPNSATTPIDRSAARSFQASPSPISPTADVENVDSSSGRKQSGRRCCTCDVDVSPRWWLIDKPSADVQMVNGFANGRPSDHPSNHVGRPPNGNNIVKREPLEIAPLNIPQSRDLVRYQCHKCHVEKRTPPTSPSQIKPKEKPMSEMGPDPTFFNPPSFPQHPAPPSIYTPGRPPFDTPGHAHQVPPPPPPPPPSVPPTNGVPPPHSPWSGPTSHWSPHHPPAVRNGSHPPHSSTLPAAAPPAYPPTYRAGLPPPGPVPDYGHPYARPGPYNSVPPPLPPHSTIVGAGPPVNGAVHPPPPPPPPPIPPSAASYGQPHPPPPPPPAGVQSTRPLSPRSYHDRSAPSPSTVGLTTSVLSLPFVPPDQARGPPMGSPASTYNVVPNARPYSNSLSLPPPPPLPPALPVGPPAMPRPSVAQNLVQIAQAASEQSNHSRHASMDNLSTPRVMGQGLPMMSPSKGPVTPVDGVVGSAPTLSNLLAADPPRNSTTPGASASPSLRNLLS